MDNSIFIPEFNAWFKDYIFKQNIYHSMIQGAKVYNNPTFTLKDLQNFFPALSYRVINDWDKKELISGTRKNQDAGWRKFSIMDIIKFFIIIDLRKYGMPIPKIKKVIDDLSRNFIYVTDQKTGELKKTEYLHFEYFLILSSVGDKILLLIDDRQYTLLQDEKNMFYLISLKDFYSPCMLLPFYDYVRKFYKWLSVDIQIEKHSTIYDLLKIRFDLKENIIMDLVNNNKYKKIEIIRKNNDHILITAKSIRSGKFNKKDVLDLIDQKNYQSVKAIQENDQIVAISQEERFWV